MQRHIAQASATVGGSSLQGAGKCCWMVCAIRCRVVMACARLIRRARQSSLGASFALPSPVSQHGESIFHPPLFLLPSDIRSRSLLRSFHSLSTLLPALRPLVKSASLPRSFLLFALSALATAKQALGQHLHASTQPLILSRLWPLLEISSL
ncbi:hypothetical protein BU25DRAFT_134435 [Macroventuria anomochaeta]|uniref:Uncharacterized protein n=1 Tax=Macroventuria anomochaeta TaxID=301207 RepID=A0ACB6RV19_9PLEO|nr:uncharacterized protein BU25DRAFT_134435 [Macroventuria anomochaeta]KAF2624789.1 hypothetical protein BU25DRAFT_134435 [Macroventuria anomochaeta]